MNILQKAVTRAASLGARTVATALGKRLRPYLLDHGLDLYRPGPITATSLTYGAVPGTELFASNLCRFEDMVNPAYRELLATTIRQPLELHRKQWEWLYIIHALKSRGFLVPGKRGLGFGVGKEPLASYFASQGCEILATDAPRHRATSDWSATNQHASDLHALHHPHLIDRSDFDRRCRFMPLDMTDHARIPEGYDFHYSACTVEHLGGISATTAFLAESARRLAPGGIAVHTTEFNLTDDERTRDEPDTCFLRNSDLRRLQECLPEHAILEPLVLDNGLHPYNYHVDVYPYDGSFHLRLIWHGFVVTSIALIFAGPNRS